MNDYFNAAKKIVGFVGSGCNQFWQEQKMYSKSFWMLPLPD